MSIVYVNDVTVTSGGETVTVGGGGRVTLTSAAKTPWRKATPVFNRESMTWRRAISIGSSFTVSAQDSTRLASDSFTFRWKDSIKLRSDPYHLPWRKAMFLPSKPLPMPWQQAIKRNDDSLIMRWQKALPMFRPYRLAWQGAALHANRSFTLAWSQGGGTSGAIARAPWQQATLVVSDGGPWQPTRLEVIAHRKTVEVHFCRPATVPDPHHVDVFLGVDPCENVSGNAPVFIVEKKVYMAINSFAASTVLDNLPIPFYSMTLQADAGSFGWTFSATGPQALMERLSPVAGAPVEINVVLNGLMWRFGIEGIQRNRSFGQNSVSVTGRSMTMLASDPYSLSDAYTNPSIINAAVQAAALLDQTNIDLDWIIDDWQLPANSFSFQGTPVGGILNILEAAGGILQSHRTDRKLIALPYYPTLPWEWGSTDPDVELPLAVITTEGYQRNDQPNYRGIYVAGSTAQARIIRAGTDGLPEAPMYTSPMANDPVAATQKGRSVLGRVGIQATMSINIPVLVGTNEPGVIDVNKLVQVIDPAGNWKGIVRSVSINAAPPSLTQTLTIERHL